MTIRTSIKNILDAVTHQFGLSIERHFGNELGLKQINKIFQEQQINMLLDVGANTGQYAMSIFKSGYKGQIISFEPLEDAYRILTTNSLKQSNWHIHPRAAIGDSNGTTVINISANSHSSSLLPITDIHTKSAPSAKYIGQLETPIVTLDSIFESITSATDRICLKIDTQGFEDKVLSGATRSLHKISLLQLELSLIPLYEGSKTVEWMIPYLKEAGFEAVFFLPGYIDRTTGEIQQLEALFVNKGNE